MISKTHYELEVVDTEAKAEEFAQAAIELLDLAARLNEVYKELLLAEHTDNIDIAALEDIIAQLRINAESLNCAVDSYECRKEMEHQRIELDNLRR